jgi:uncharacterized membrane protein
MNGSNMSANVIKSEVASLSFKVSFEQKRVALVVLTSIAIVVPVWLYGIPSNQDLFNHFRFALPFFDALRAGHFYPGWLGESNGGYGDPSFRFYPPALYYLLAAARALSGNWYAGTLLTITFLSVLAGLGVYFWARLVLPANAAVWAAVLYAVAPYHVNQLYQAFLFAEYAAAAILPFAFASVESICQRRRWRDAAGFGATYALLVLTHLPLAVIGSLALAVYALARIEKPHWRDSIKKILAGLILGLAASSIYWIKMIPELSWIAINTVRPDSSVDYRMNFLFSTFSPTNLNVWWMNILALVTFLLFAPAFVLLFRQTRSEFNRFKPIAVLALFALFMATPLSWPLWKFFSPLQQTQFPWRWLAIVSAGGCVLAAAGISHLLKVKVSSAHQRVLKLIFVGGILVSVSFTLAHTVREAQYRNTNQFESDLATVRGTSSVGYWLPIWASATPAPMTSQVIAANRSITVDKWDPQNRAFKVSSGQPTEARIMTFYYPLWLATVNGNVLPTRADRDGALLISLPPQHATIELNFHEPVRFQFALAFSALGWMLIGFLALPLSVRGKS